MEPKIEFEPLVKPGKFYAFRVWLFVMRLRMRDALQLKKRIQWFHRRFRVRYFDGSPWHGLAKFNASTAANIIFASGKKQSAFAELHSASPEIAEEMIGEAYLGKSEKEIFRKHCGYWPRVGTAMSLHEYKYMQAIAEAVEIYSPKP